MEVKQGERSVSTEYCLSVAAGARVYSVQRSEPQFYTYFSIVLTFSLVISFVSRQKK